MKTLENAKNQVAAADILWLRGGTIANYSVQKQKTDKHGKQLCQTSKTRQKLDWKIREIDAGHICACNYLTNFEYEVQEMTGNRNCLNVQKN